MENVHYIPWKKQNTKLNIWYYTQFLDKNNAWAYM